MKRTEKRDVPARVEGLDWGRLGEELDDRGWTTVERVLHADECRSVAALFDDDARFRKHVDMAGHGYGRGEYRYFSYPLPDLVAELRTSFYCALAPVANRWNERMRIGIRYPDSHEEFVQRCHDAGQKRPTPLLLRYGAGDYNHLHQDVYGEHVFPLQVAFLLSEPGDDFTGGELVLTEQRPRMQSRVSVVPLCRGDGVIFAVRHHPVQGARTIARANMRHGVSLVRSGHRQTLGMIFHDAQ